MWSFSWTRFFVKTHEVKTCGCRRRRRKKRRSSRIGDQETKKKKKKTKEKKSREEGTRRAQTPDKGSETSGGGYLQERQLSQMQLVGTKILTLVGR